MDANTPRQRSAMVPLVDESRDRLYSAQRRFDLVTLLTITSAYAVLFTWMRLFQWSLAAFALVAVFVTSVGVGQAFLFQGTRPRAASVLVGAAYWAGLPFFMALLSGARPPYYPFPCVGCGSAISGAVSGYVCGVLIGGVFMLAEFFRSALTHRREPQDGKVPDDADSGPF